MKDDKWVYKIRRKMQCYAYDFTSPEFVSKLYFRIVLGQKLNLKFPKTYNEKLQWLKLYYYPRNQKAVQCTDKYAVRNYIEEKGMGYLLNELYDVWDEPDSIEWDALPKQFVLKCTHGCGYNLICDDKSKLDIVYTKNKLKMWMQEDFGKFNAEPHYSKIPKRIICEKYLGKDIIDYKFFCFHGEPKFMYIAQGFGNGIDERISFFEMNGKRAEYGRSDYPVMEDARMPEKFQEMAEISRVLGENFPFVRVDLFEVAGKIYFSELTFTPCGCMMKIDPKMYDVIWGTYIDLEKVNMELGER